MHPEELQRSGRGERPGRRIHGAAAAFCLLLGAACAAPGPAAPRREAPGPRSPGDAPGPLVVLITDFGEESSYVGQMKGAIYRECPSARIDQITHLVPAFDVAAGARLLAEAAPLYPEGTVFVGVVDPGVGTERRAIGARSPGGTIFIGPDNGLLVPAMEAVGATEVRGIGPAYTRGPSTTFHGRDIFGPTAGRLACGGRFEDLSAKTVDDLVRLPADAIADEGAGTAMRTEGGRTIFSGAIREIDRYGNVITTIPASRLEEAGVRTGDRLVVRIGDEALGCPWVKAYGDVPEGEVLALKNSRGLVEIAVNRGKLAERVKAGADAAVEVEVR